MVNFMLDTRVPGFRVGWPEDEEGILPSLVPLAITPAAFNPDADPAPVALPIPTGPLPSIFDLIATSPYLRGSLPRSTDSLEPDIDAPTPRGWLSRFGESTTGMTMPAGHVSLSRRPALPSFAQTMASARYPWSIQQPNSGNFLPAGSGNNDRLSWFDSPPAVVDVRSRPFLDFAEARVPSAQAPTQPAYAIGNEASNVLPSRGLIARQAGSLPLSQPPDQNRAHMFADDGLGAASQGATFARPADTAQITSGGYNSASIGSAQTQARRQGQPATPMIDLSPGHAAVLPNGSIISSIGSLYGYANNANINTTEPSGTDRRPTQGHSTEADAMPLGDLNIHLVGDTPSELSRRERHELGVDDSVAMHIRRGFEIVTRKEVAVDVPGFPYPRYYDYIIRDPATGLNYGVEVKTTIYKTIQLRPRQVMKDAVVVAQGAKVRNMDVRLSGVSYSAFCFGCEALDLRSLALQRILQNAGVPVTRGTLPGDVRR